MNKRQAMRTISNSGGYARETEFEIEGEGFISYTTTTASSIMALRIEGSMWTLNGVTSPVGIVTDDGVIIKLRIRGETVLDGYEFERIMKKRGSPCYGGTVDEDHFLYIAKDDESYTLIDRTDMYIPNGALSVIGEAILYEALPVGKTATGMQIVTAGGSRAISFGGTEGAVSFSGHNGNDYYNCSLTHKPVESEFRYAIAYDSLRIVQNGNVTTTPYNGYIREIKLSAPLYRIGSPSGDDIYDEIDVLSGVVTRRTATARAVECAMDIIYYRDLMVFRLSMPNTIGDGDVEGTTLYKTEPEYLNEDVDCFIVSPDKKSLYINLGEDITTIEEAREYIGDCSFLYPLAEEKIEQVTPPEISTDSGTVGIEVCSIAPARIYAIYKG